METLFQDVRFAVRTLLRSRGFAVAAILTLALGIGANTAIFSVVNAVLLRPLPYGEPDRLAMVWLNNPRQGIERDVTSAPNFLDWKSRNTVFEDLAALVDGYRNLTNTDEPERLPVGFVSDGFFPVMGVEPLLGRGFTAEEHQQGADQVVVLSHGLWTRRFGADASIVGRTISLNAEPHVVVGVMPPGFDFPEESALWIPLAFAPDESRGALWLNVIGRLREGVTLEQAQAQMSTIARDLEREYPMNEGMGILLERLRDHLVGGIRPALLVLLGAVGFVLLIACANVGNLLFARAAARQKEIAIRSALGAGQGRVVRQVLTESLLLALFGGVAGLVLAFWGVGVLTALAPADLPRLDSIRVDGTVLLFTLGISVLTGVLFGMVPALQISRPELTSWLREGGRGATGGAGSARMRRTLVAAETGLALILLIGAGLMIRSFATLRAVEPGFVTDQVLTMRVSLPEAKYSEPEQVTLFYREVLESIERLPGVRSASAATAVLLSRLPNMAPIVIEGRPELPSADERFPIPYDAVTPGYFETMGMEVIAGRALTDRDDPRAPPAVVVNQALVRRFFPDADPLGQRISFGAMPDSDDGWLTIVGVVEDVRRSGLDAEPRPEAYLSHLQQPVRSMLLTVRTESDPTALVAPIRRAIRAIDPDQPVADIRTLEQALAESVASRRFSMLLLSLFSGVAALLAAIGIYGLMAYSVAQRTREIGVRIALGAESSDVLSLVIRQALILVVPGLALGTLGALALTRLLSGMLYGISPTDPLTFVGVALLLAAVALLASYLPARRATRVDPMIALRAE